MRAEPSEESKFQWLARFGFLIRGLLYIVIALLVIGTGRTEDLTGAMEYVGDGFGRWLLILMLIGMTGYGAWQLFDAVLGTESGRHHPRAWGRRIAAGTSGAIYCYLAWKALEIMGERRGTGDAHRHVAMALHLPAGDLALAVAAVILLGAGIVQFYKSGTCSFLLDLDNRARMPLAKWLGRIGYAARGAVFITAGWLLARAAAWDHSAARAGGIEQALDALRGPLQFPIAAGLLLFGFYSILEARFRTIRDVPTDHIKQKIEEVVAP